MSEDNQIDFIEPDNYGFEKDQSFSHRLLVMRSIDKCRENGQKEMRDGYVNTKFDRLGNAHKVIMPDTRKEFIESVKTAINMMYCDLDEKSKKIDEYEKLIEKIFKQLNLSEKKEIEEANFQVKQNRAKQGIYYIEGVLNQRLPFYNIYLDFKMDIYRKILNELILLTKRLKYYKDEEYEA